MGKAVESLLGTLQITSCNFLVSQTRRVIKKSAVLSPKIMLIFQVTAQVLSPQYSLSSDNCPTSYILMKLNTSPFVFLMTLSWFLYWLSNTYTIILKCLLYQPQNTISRVRMYTPPLRYVKMFSRIGAKLLGGLLTLLSRGERLQAQNSLC